MIFARTDGGDDIHRSNQVPATLVAGASNCSALPLVIPQYRNVRTGGVVIYATHTVRIPRGALPGQFIENLGSLIRRLAADEPARRVPTFVECGFCDVSAADCPSRVEDEHEPEDGDTDDF